MWHLFRVWKRLNKKNGFLWDGGGISIGLEQYTKYVSWQIFLSKVTQTTPQIGRITAKSTQCYLNKSLGYTMISCRIRNDIFWYDYITTHFTNEWFIEVERIILFLLPSSLPSLSLSLLISLHFFLHSNWRKLPHFIHFFRLFIRNNNKRKKKYVN